MVSSYFFILYAITNGETHRKNCPLVMSTTPKPSQNGTTAKPVQAPQNGNPKPVVSTTVTVARLPVKIEEPKPELDRKISVEDAFLKLDQLQAKREKWEELKECENKLNKFDLSYTGRTDNITFKDSKGTTFSTCNPAVIAMTIAWLQKDTAARLKELEAQIQF